MLSLLKEGCVSAAPKLIGWRLYTLDNGIYTGGTIIETEAYSQEDAASHSYKGISPRTEVMFGAAGYTYVYFTYGMHWCMNIVTGEQGHGEAVLIRAIVPERGIDIIRERRGHRDDLELTNGPAKVCQALAVTGKDNGLYINDGRFQMLPPVNKFSVIATERIGIRNDTHRLWRFVAAK